MTDGQIKQPIAPEPKRVLTRIYIQPDGNLVVTDLWEEARMLLPEDRGFHVEDENI